MILLQTVSTQAVNTDGSKGKFINVIFDTGSQKSYISRRLVKDLNLKPESERNVVINTFADINKKPVTVRKYSLCLQTLSGSNFYIYVDDIPDICSPVCNRAVNVAAKDFPFLNKSRSSPQNFFDMGLKPYFSDLAELRNVFLVVSKEGST